jgi:hypothetical protein
VRRAEAAEPRAYVVQLNGTGCQGQIRKSFRANIELETGDVSPSARRNVGECLGKIDLGAIELGRIN